jgi:hypothetical protein
MYQTGFATYNVNGTPELCRDADDFLVIVREAMGSEPASILADIIEERQDMEDELEELKKQVALALAGIENIYSAIDEQIEKRDFVVIKELVKRLREHTDEAEKLV